MTSEIMAWTQVIIFNLGVLILFILNRSEYRQDHERLNEQMQEIRSLLDDIRTESKDFHARLCAIEERNRK